MAHIFGSIWDRRNRNALNELSKSIEYQGKSIQDLVAKGQLTPTQYAQLIKVVNGLISKGDVTTDDLDKNYFKLDSTYFSNEFINQLQEGKVDVTNILDGSVERKHISNNSVTHKKTTFFDMSNNEFNKEAITENSSIDFDGTVISDSSRWLSDYIEVPKSKTMSITSGSYRIGVFKSDGTWVNRTGITNLSLIDLNTYSGLLYIRISGTYSTDPETIMLNNGSTLLPYEPYSVKLKEEYQKEIPKDNTVTVIEDPFTGYPDRPDATSVIWVGPNEPQGGQVYDEWRETGGFVYFTDFTEYPGGVELSDWSKPWTSGSIQTIASSKSPVDGGGRVLVYSADSSGMFSLKWDKIDNDSFQDDAEVFFRGYVPSEPNSQHTSVLLRGSGTADNFSGYVMGPNGANIRISKYVNGNISMLSETNTNVDFTKYFNLVGRVEKDEVKVKVWQHGKKEPNDWLISTVDTELTTSNFNGMFSFSSASTFVDLYGVGTGGMRAPRNKVVR